MSQNKNNFVEGKYEDAFKQLVNRASADFVGDFMKVLNSVVADYNSQERDAEGRIAWVKANWGVIYSMHEGFLEMAGLPDFDRTDSTGKKMKYGAKFLNFCKEYFKLLSDRLAKLGW